MLRTNALFSVGWLLFAPETAGCAQEAHAAPELNGPEGPRWSFVAFACQFNCRRRVVPDHHEVAGVLDAMVGGDAVLMFLGPWHGLDSLALDDLLALRITFAAQDAELRRVAWTINVGKRIRFVPKDPHSHVSLRLDQVALADLLKTLATFGEVQLPGWTVSPRCPRSGSPAPGAPTARPTGIDGFDSGAQSASQARCKERVRPLLELAANRGRVPKPWPARPGLKGEPLLFAGC